MIVWRRWVFAIAATAVVVAWALGGPRSLGGGADYVVVARGSSMQPTLELGDLVVTRPSATYVVGDIVAVRIADGPVVVHRVVAAGADGYTTRGDANAFDDPERPTSSQIIGRMAMRVPAAGRLVAFLRDGGAVSVLVGLLVFMIGMAYLREGPSKPQSGRAHHPTRSAVEHAGVALLVGGLIVGAVGMFGSLEQDGTVPVTYRTSFRTTGLGAAGTVYPNGRVADGQPFYVNIVDRARVVVSAAAQGPDGEMTKIAGTWKMDAVLSSSAGWSRSFPLGNGKLVDGAGAGVLDLQVMGRNLAAFEQQTGEREGQYPVTITTKIEAVGALSGVGFAKTLTPALAMRFDHRRLFHAEPGVTAASPDVLGTMTVPGVDAGTIAIAGRVIATRLVRIFGAALLMLGAAAGVAGVLFPWERFAVSPATAPLGRASKEPDGWSR